MPRISTCIFTKGDPCHVLCLICMHISDIAHAHFMTNIKHLINIYSAYISHVRYLHQARHCFFCSLSCISFVDHFSSPCKFSGHPIPDAECPCAASTIYAYQTSK